MSAKVRKVDANGYDYYVDHDTGVSVSRQVDLGAGKYRYEHDFRRTDGNNVVFNAGTKHQGVMGGIAGTREDWSDNRTHRTDNRWDPNSAKDASNEAETGFTQVAGVSVGQGQNNPVGGGPVGPVGPPGGPPP